MAATAQAKEDDIELNSAESVPRETLIAMLKRKDKEAKTSAAKLAKVEERFVKQVRFNKILMEDRSSFLKFCNELLPDSDFAFEEAAAQEVTVNVDILLRRLGTWRETLEVACEDRKLFRSFVELIFPNDEEVGLLFEQPGAEPVNFEALRNKWIAFEELQSKSLASVSVAARDALHATEHKVEALEEEKKAVEAKLAAAEAELGKLAKEKAQALTSKLRDGTSGEAVPAPHDGPGSTTVGGVAMSDDAQSRWRQEAERLQERLREVSEGMEQREAEQREEVNRREEEHRAALEAESQRREQLVRELDRLKEEGERSKAHARELLNEKDAFMDKLQNKMKDLETELSSNSFIENLAEKQASRDQDLNSQQKNADALKATLAEIQRLLHMSYDQEKVLKERIRELEQSHGRSFVDRDYLKYVVMMYIQYTQKADLKAQSLIPVICTVLNLNAEERRQVENQVIPQPFLILNSAVGEAASWFRGGG